MKEGPERISRAANDNFPRVSFEAQETFDQAAAKLELYVNSLDPKGEIYRKYKDALMSLTLNSKTAPKDSEGGLDLEALNRVNKILKTAQDKGL